MSRQIQPLHITPVADQVHWSIELPDGPFDLRMARVADEDDRSTLTEIAPPLAVDFGDKWTGRVEHGELPRFSVILDHLRHTMCTKDRARTARNLREVLYEACALGLQALNHMAVVHNLVPHIDRRSILLKGPLDDLDGSNDAGTVAARLGQDHLHALTRS